MTPMQQMQQDLNAMLAKRYELNQKRSELEKQRNETENTIAEITYRMEKLESDTMVTATLEKQERLQTIHTQLKRNGELNQENVPDLIEFIEKHINI